MRRNSHNWLWSSRTDGLSLTTGFCVTTSVLFASGVPHASRIGLVGRSAQRHQGGAQRAGDSRGVECHASLIRSAHPPRLGV